MKQRLVILSICVFSLFALLIGHYFTLQIAQYDIWKKRAAAQHEISVKEPFKRGTFFVEMDQKTAPLALDVTQYHLYLDPLSIPKAHKESVFTTLQEKIGLSDESRKEFDLSSRSRCLKRWLHSDDKENVLNWWHSYSKKNKIASNALYFITDYKRSYPYGSLLGQVLHTIRDRKEEKTDQAYPTGGLETYFNKWLAGKVGERKLLRSPRNRLEIDQLITPPEDGADIYLTINPFVQTIAENELKAGVLSAQAKGGWAVVMEAKTGHILALAHYPFFDPSQYRSYFNDPQKSEFSKVHAVSDAHEIGSIMKPITMALGLKANRELSQRGEAPLFDPNEPMDVTRSKFPGRMSKPLCDLPRHKAINMDMAIQKSSNVYMAEVADRIVKTLGVDWYRDELIHSFGFESKTGIELPAEALGLVPSRKRYHPNGAPEWSVPTPYSLSIGYNLLATGIQMLRAYAVIANGGYLVSPTLVARMEKGGEVLLDHTLPMRRQVLDSRDAKRILEAMKYTTQVGGSGALAQIAGYTEAGKTGSAEKIVEGKYAKRVHLSSFMGITPADPMSDNPLVVLISIDEPAPLLQENGRKGYLGGRCAAPIFKAMMTKVVKVLGMVPDDPHGYPKNDPRYDANLADWHPEVANLKRQYEEWNR